MSITKVARRAGVSYVTVSRALNHPDKVNPDTLARIRRIFRDMNYTPRVVPNRVRTVCLLTPAGVAYNPADSVLTNHIIPALNREGYHAVLSPVSAIESAPEILRGAFIGVLHEGDEEAARIVEQYSPTRPFVVIDDLCKPSHRFLTRVRSDHSQGTRLALDHLLHRGHRRIAYVGPPPQGKGYLERFQAYRDAMQRRGLFNESLVFQSSDEMLIDGIRRLCRERATAVLVVLPTLVPQVLHYLRLLDKDVPRDLSLVACEFEGGTPHLYPPLTSIVQPIAPLGELAATLAIRRLRGETVKPNHLLPYRLAERGSVRSL